ncbi:MAG: hypothetical protein ACE5JU_24555 [Candidatus Binatia bacterium]
MQFKQGPRNGCRALVSMVYRDARGITDPPTEAIEPGSRQIKAGWQKGLAVDQASECP